MPSRFAAFERYVDPTPRLIFTLTAGILFVHGLMMAYKSHLKEVLNQTFGLSGVEWIAFIGGPFLLEPVLLFSALYYVRSRREPTLSLTALLPGLVIAVVAGNLLGQFVGVDLWGAYRDQPGMALPLSYDSFLFAPGPLSYWAWIILVEPLVHELLVVVAALGLAQTRQTERAENEQ